MKSHIPLLRIDVAALGSGAESSVHERPRRLPPEQCATPVESEDLARFEGEGGLEAPELAVPPHEKEGTQ